MNKLKSAIADKVLEISTSDSSEIKSKLEKINRFRDFTEACQTLILKYPAIETEFLRMIEKNDFDSRIASSRVDTIIRLSENEASNTTSHKNIEKDITELEEITELLPIVDNTITNSQTSDTTSSESNGDKSLERASQKSATKEIETCQAEAIKELPEDIPYEEIDNEKEYVDFEEISEESHINIEPEILSQHSEINSKNKDNSKKDTAKKIIQICGIIAIIIALIFIIKFVINNWEILLWILGGCVVATGVVWFLMKKNKAQ